MASTKKRSHFQKCKKIASSYLLVKGKIDKCYYVTLNFSDSDLLFSINAKLVSGKYIFHVDKRKIERTKGGKGKSEGGGLK